MAPITDFDHYIDRRESGSLKWGRYRGTDIIPAWVADMDIPTPEVVIAAMQKRLQSHPLLGYERSKPSTFAAIQDYLQRYHGWQVAEEAIVFLPGLVPAINWCCAMAGEAGDEILVPSPIYPPFLSAPGNQGRRCRRLPHVREGEDFVMALERWEELVSPESRALLFCHPHNPLGRWWRDDELASVVDFCQRHDLLLISDEIHCQLLLDERPGNPTFRSSATVNDWARAHTVTLLSPPKTSNMPGMACAYAVIEDPDLRRRFQRASAGCIPEISPLSYVALEAAYNQGEPWRAELLAFLRRNRDLLHQAVQDWPGVQDNHLEATYLAWLDVRDLGLDNPHAAFEAGGVGLGEGIAFGDPQCVRVNLGTTLPQLTSIIERMDTVIRRARA